ncbi:MAG: chorismate-binding protein [Prevotellaceae bacterium]|nr:chorismate-binding protein [Prevotellaceae bacterium]
MVEDIHRAVEGAQAFAMYRLPFSDECHIVAQQSEQSRTLHDLSELEGRSGFVMAPFHADSRHPIIFISPETEQCIPFRTDLRAVTNAPADRPGNPEVCEEDYDSYRQVFRKFHTSLCSGEFEKLVLSRRKKLHVGNVHPVEIFIRACSAYPRMMVYLCSAPECGTWLGCTPEILLAGSKSHYRTVALAGTMAPDNPDTTSLHSVRWSDKNREEQKIVADFIREKLKPHTYVIEEEGPYTSRAGRLLHLKTEFHFSSVWSREGHTKPDSSGPATCAAPTPECRRSMSGLISSLHPTPAVCGLPQEKALRFIIENEGYDRRYYSGIVGMLNFHDETNLYVNLRCSSIAADGTAVLYAGGGLLPSSTVESEWQETEEKLKTILNVFR